MPLTALPESASATPRTQGREAEHGFSLTGSAYIRNPETRSIAVARPNPTVPADWGTAFAVNLAGHLARNLTWAKWSDNLFVYGRRVPENLGAGNVIVIPTGGREGGYRLGERRAVEGYPSFPYHRADGTAGRQLRSSRVAGDGDTRPAFRQLDRSPTGTGRLPVTSGASRAAGATSRLTISQAPRKPAGVPIPWRCRRCGRTVDPKLRDVDELCKACAIAARGRKAPID